VKRQLLRLEPLALESQVNLCFLHERERQKLETGNCHCYLARDSGGAITLFLVLTCGAAAEDMSSVKTEYSRSLECEGAGNILQDSGMSRLNRKGPRVSEK
jgi:hypothetical protein